MSLLLLSRRGGGASGGGGGGGGGTPFFSDNFASGNFTKTENNASWNAQRNLTIVQCDTIGLTRPPTNSANVVRGSYPAAGNFAQLDLSLDTVGAGYGEIWLRYYLYWPNGTEGGTVGPAVVNTSGGIGLKQLRVYDTPTNGSRSWAFGAESFYPPAITDPSTASGHGIYLYSGGPTFYNSPGQFQSYSTRYDIPLGQWLKVQWQIKTNTVEASGWNVGGDGILRLYINDTLRLETTTGSLCPANGKMRGLYLLGNNNAAFDNSGTMVYLSDVAVSATGAM
jgi:hypothetical protein